MVVLTGSDTTRRSHLLASSVIRIRPAGPTAARIAFLGQIFTLAATWQLWAARDAPPTFPIVDGLATIGWGWPLVVTLALAVAPPAGRWSARSRGLRAGGSR